MVDRIREGVDPSELTLDTENANRGTERGSYLLTESLREAGPGRSIVVDKHGKVIGGNKTLEAAIAAGIPLTVIPSHGESLVVHQRMDLDLDDPESPARKLAYLDNRSQQVSLEWDIEQMQADHMQGKVDLTEFFWVSELEQMGIEIETELTADIPQKESYRPQSMDPPMEDPVVAGQVYRCGGHTLSVGQEIKQGDALVMIRAFEEYTGTVCEIENPDGDFDL
jgi:hypothetical protein